MRTINANITTEQKKLTARPALSFTVGATAYDISAYVVAYRYDEHAEVPGRHEIVLDNSAGTWNTLTGAKAAITAGNYLTMNRGVTVAGTDYTAELPRLWIEALEYTYAKSQAQLIIHLIDPWEKLRRTRVATAQTWTVQPATEILEYIVEAAGLTLSDIILNGNFETYSAPDWTYWVRRVSDGAIAAEGSIVHGGSYAVKLTAGASVDTWVYQDIVTEPNHRYNLRVWARGDGTYSGRYALYDSINAAWITALTTLGVTNATYEQVDINFLAPAACTGVRLYLACPSTDTGYCYVDDVEVLAAVDHLLVDFEIVTSEHLYNAARRLLRSVSQYAYWALDGALKTKELDPAEASAYTLGWNANHQLLQVQRSSEKAWEVNSVTVNGSGAFTATVTDATQIAAVGTRHLTVQDVRLGSNATCTTAATALLRYFEARATETILITHPVHGLELYDMLTLDTPPWGGANVTGRVIAILETYSHDRRSPSGGKGSWQQVITLGYPSRYINRPGTDGSLIVNIPAAGIVLDHLSALTAWTGDLTVDGELKIETGGYMHSGQTGYDTGTGFWMEYNAGTPRFSIGAAAGSRVTWDGTTLTVVGTVTATAGELQTLSVTGTLTLSGSGKLITAASPAARVELSTTELAGYSDATTKQFYLDATSGKAYAGAGNVELSADGIYIELTTTVVSSRSLNFVDASDNVICQIAGSAASASTYLYLYANDMGGDNDYATIYMQATATGTGYGIIYLYASHETNASCHFAVYNMSSAQQDRVATVANAWLSVEQGLIVGNDSVSVNYPQQGWISLKDGVTAPGAGTRPAGFATLYVDTADGDLKVQFADGFTVTLAADS